MEDMAKDIKKLSLWIKIQTLSYIIMIISYLFQAYQVYSLKCEIRDNVSNKIEYITSNLPKINRSYLGSR